MSVVAATDEKTDATTVAIVARRKIGPGAPHEPTITPCAPVVARGSTDVAGAHRAVLQARSLPYRGNDHSVLSFVDRASVEAELRSTDRLVGPCSH